MRGMAWLLVPMAPASHLLFFPGTFVAERVLYIPTIGLVWLLAALLSPSPALPNHTHYYKGGVTTMSGSHSLPATSSTRPLSHSTLRQRKGQRPMGNRIDHETSRNTTSTTPCQVYWSYKAMWTTIVIWCGLMAFRSYHRAAQWRSAYELFTADAAARPGSGRLQLNSGIQHWERQEYDEAALALGRAAAVQNVTGSCQPSYWLGRLALDQQQYLVRLHISYGVHMGLTAVVYRRRNSDFVRH